MARTDREAADRLTALFAALHERPYEFSFLQAVRQLEAAARHKPRIGASARAADDAVRFGQDPSLAFAPAELAALDYSAQGKPPRLSVAFIGLMGPNGPLPLHVTEYARDRQRNGHDATLVGFLDIFHHRVYSLFYRAWATAQPTTQFDRPESDRFAAFAGAFAGISSPVFRNRDAMPDLAKLFFAGRFVCHARNAEGLQAMLREFFQMPMVVDEFVGRWIAIPDDCRCRLEAVRPAAGLGVSAAIGSQVWDCQQTFRISAGPLSLSEYERLLPGGGSLKRLEAVIRNYVGLELAWEIRLILRQKEVQPVQLGQFGRLGWTSWLVSGPAAKDGDELVLRPLGAA